MNAADDIPEMLDLIFDLRGDELPQDHREALWVALTGAMPWLARTPLVGVHTIRAAPTTYGVILLAQRAKLVLRLPEANIDEARALQGATLDVAGHAIRIGAAHARSLPAAATLYADFVTTGSTDETGFQADIARELARLNSPCHFICGRRRASQLAGQELGGFAVALHDVPLEQSRLLQSTGLGRARHLGCGILVQHKTITGLH